MKANILIITTNKSLATATASLVTSMEMRPHGALSAKDAYHKCNENDYSLIFLDLDCVYECSVYKLLENIDALNKQIPIIAHGDEDGGRRLVRARMFGATDFIAAPLTLDKLRKTLDEYLLDVPAKPRRLSF